jgi:transposase
LRLGPFDEDARAADLLQEYEAMIAALERMVSRQAVEIEFLKGR